MRMSVFAFIAAGLMPASALAEALSTNYYVTNNLPHEQCMDRAREVMRGTGLRPMPNTSEAVWAESHNRRTLASIYCLKTRDVAVLMVAGRQLSETIPVLQRLMVNWEEASEQSGPGLRPGSGGGQGSGDAPMPN